MPVIARDKGISMKMRQTIMAAAVALATVGMSAANAATIYDTSPGLAGNQNWSGTLGLNFTVNSKVSVTALGVFNALSASDTPIRLRQWSAAARRRSLVSSGTGVWE